MTADIPVGVSAQAALIAWPRTAARSTASSGRQHAGQRRGGEFAHGVSAHRGSRRQASCPAASRAVATTSGWVTAVSLISSAPAVVPSAIRSRWARSDIAAA